MLQHHHHCAKVVTFSTDVPLYFRFKSEPVVPVVDADSTVPVKPAFSAFTSMVFAEVLDCTVLYAEDCKLNTRQRPMTRVDASLRHHASVHDYPEQRTSHQTHGCRERRGASHLEAARNRS